jgi:hypothetical protein
MTHKSIIDSHTLPPRSSLDLQSRVRIQREHVISITYRLAESIIYQSKQHAPPTIHQPPCLHLKHSLVQTTRELPQCFKRIEILGGSCRSVQTESQIRLGFIIYILQSPLARLLVIHNLLEHVLGLEKHHKVLEIKNGYVRSVFVSESVNVFND